MNNLFEELENEEYVDNSQRIAAVSRLIEEGADLCARDTDHFINSPSYSLYSLAMNNMPIFSNLLELDIITKFGYIHEHENIMNKIMTRLIAENEPLKLLHLLLNSGLDVEIEGNEIYTLVNSCLNTKELVGFFIEREYVSQMLILKELKNTLTESPYILQYLIEKCGANWNWDWDTTGDHKKSYYKFQANIEKGKLLEIAETENQEPSSALIYANYLSGALVGNLIASPLLRYCHDKFNGANPEKLIIEYYKESFIYEDLMQPVYSVLNHLAIPFGYFALENIFGIKFDHLYSGERTPPIIKSPFLQGLLVSSFYDAFPLVGDIYNIGYSYMFGENSLDNNSLTEL